METSIRLIFSCFIFFQACSTSKNPNSVFVSASQPFDTLYFNSQNNWMLTVSEYREYFDKYRTKYSELKVKKINSPLKIEQYRDLYDRTIRKFQCQLDTILPQLPNLSHFKKYFFAEDLKTANDFSRYSFSIIPIYRMTANLMDIQSFEKEQFANYLTFDTINHVIMVKKEDKVIDMYVYCEAKWMGNATWNGGLLQALDTAIARSNNYFAIVGPEFDTGVPLIYGFIENGRLFVLNSIGSVGKKIGENRYIADHNIYAPEDNNNCFRHGLIATTWLESYFEKVEYFRQHPDRIGVGRDPQFLIYPAK